MKLRGERGIVAVEFAIILPVLLLLVFGITEFGRLWMTKNIMTQAAREGARYAAVLSPSDWDEASVKERVKESLIGASLEGEPTIVVFSPAEGDPPTVKVKIEGIFHPLSGSIIPALSGDIPLKAQSTFRYEWEWEG